MSIQNIRNTIPFAMKDYSCDACVWIRQSGVHHGIGTGLTFSELRAIATAKSHEWRILKGEKYEKQINIQDGELRTYRAIPAIHKICLKLDMFSDC